MMITALVLALVAGHGVARTWVTVRELGAAADPAPPVDAEVR